MENIEDVIRRLKIGELTTVALTMDCDEEAWTSQVDDAKKRRALIRAIEDKIEEVDENERLETIKTVLLPMLPTESARELKALFSAGDKKDTAEADDKVDDKVDNKVDDKFDPPLLKKEGGSQGSDATSDKMDRMMETMMILKTMGLDGSSTSAFRREFKISGSIGSTHKDSLTYIGLCSQIKDGLGRGYKEKDILSAIRHATPAGSTLRTYLDTKNDRSLDNVKNFIRHYLKEKGTTELFHEMTNLGQQRNEDAQAFILRALELREKVRIASENENPVSLDPKLIQQMFVRQVITGLSDDVVRYKLEPLLRLDASDEVLLKEVNQVMSEEAERRVKRGEKEKVSTKEAKVKVEEVKTSSIPDATATALSEAVAPIMQQMQEMAAKMNMMEKEMTKFRGGLNGPTRPHQTAVQQQHRQQQAATATPRPPFQRGCATCKTSGHGDDCRHCWRCGSDDHISRGCNQSKKPSSN